MAWTTPRTWVANEVVTAAIMNTHVRDNLNDLDGRANAYQYAVTMADVENTAAETVFLTATIANAVADGDMIITPFNYTLHNTSGGTRSASYDVLYGGVEASLGAEFEEAPVNNVDADGARVFVWTRIGSDMFVGVAGDEEAVGDHQTGARLVAPTFTASQTLSIKITLDTANANWYIREEGGFCMHWIK